MVRILLENIFLQDLVEEEVIIEENLLGITIFDAAENIWDKIENLPKIPSAEDLQCWHCTLVPQGPTEGIPLFTYNDLQFKEQVNYELHHNLHDSILRSEIKREKYIGVFCNSLCAIAFLDETCIIPAKDKEKCRKTMYHIRGLKDGRKVSYIPPAYPRYLMKIYSGVNGWSPQEYREKNKALEKLIS